jgi:site-specific recombinase XerD
VTAGVNEASLVHLLHLLHLLEHPWAAHQPGVATVIALWLGHKSAQTTQIYLHADLALKEQALNKTTPLTSAPGRYQPPDQLLAFLEAL